MLETNLMSLIFQNPAWWDPDADIQIVPGLVHPNGEPVVAADFPLTDIPTIIMRHELEGIPIPYRDNRDQWPNGELAFYTGKIDRAVIIHQHNGYSWYWNGDIGMMPNGKHAHMMIVKPKDPDEQNPTAYGDAGTWHGEEGGPVPTEQQAKARETYLRWNHWPYGYPVTDADKAWAASPSVSTTVYGSGTGTGTR